MERALNILRIEELGNELPPWFQSKPGKVADHRRVGFVRQNLADRRDRLHVATKLRLHRETLLLSLLDGKRPPGVTDDRLSGALEAGVDRAQREGAVSGLGAFGLKLALKTGGPLALIKRLVE